MHTVTIIEDLLCACEKLVADTGDSQALSSNKNKQKFRCVFWYLVWSSKTILLPPFSYRFYCLSTMIERSDWLGIFWSAEKYMLPMELKKIDNQKKRKFVRLVFYLWQMPLLSLVHPVFCSLTKAFMFVFAFTFDKYFYFNVQKR